MTRSEPRSGSRLRLGLTWLLLLVPGVFLRAQDPPPDTMRALPSPSRTVAPVPVPGRPGTRGESTPLGVRRITNVFYESDIQQALMDISAETRVPIITDGSVGGLVTAELVDATLEEALAKILHPRGYDFRNMGDYYLVASTRPDGAAFHLLAESRLIVPNYLKAEEAHALLPECYRQFLKLDRASNTLTATAPRQILEGIARHLAEIDQPKKQVLIEALITEISGGATRSLGVNWSGTFWRGADTVITGRSGPGVLADTGLTLVLKALTGQVGDVAYSLVPTINALVENGRARIRANPSVATIAGQAAEIVVGQEQYYSILAGSELYPYTRLEQIEVGVSLLITPYVADNGDITVFVEPTVSDVVGSGLNKLPIVSKRSAKTQVVVRNGQEIVIGGLVTSSEQTVRRKIPLLGDIPILGLLFSHTTRVTTENEVVIVITPRLVERPEREQNPGGSSPDREGSDR